MDEDYDLGNDFKDQLIPLALEYYLEVIEDEEEGEDDECDSCGDDHHHGAGGKGGKDDSDEDEKPAKAKGGKKKGGAGAAAAGKGPDGQECKQQWLITLNNSIFDLFLKINKHPLKQNWEN